MIRTYAEHMLTLDIVNKLSNLYMSRPGLTRPRRCMSGLRTLRGYEKALKN